MIERYTRPEMGQIWSEENKLKTWLEVELAVLEVQAKHGIVPADIPQKVKAKARFDLKRVQVIEQGVKHDVIAFLTNLSENIGPEARYLHFGMTSSDVLDSALSLQVKQATAILVKDLDELIESLRQKAIEYKNTLMVGRSHGVHAEPTTFGLKMALFFAEFRRARGRIIQAQEQMNVGKISGAVGTFANIDPQIEEEALALLGLKPDPISTQIVQRDRHAFYMATLAVIAGSLEKLATELRLLQKTETLEVEECFEPGQKGSSAMPHKRNPITCERIAGLARVIRGNAQAAFENQALWHERDITHSSVERIIFPDSTILLDYMMAQMTRVIKNLTVHKDNMRFNLEITRGMIFSQGLLLELVKKGLTREEGYKLVQDCAAKVWGGEGLNLKTEVLKDENIRKYLSEEEINSVFDFGYHTKNVNAIFKRLNLAGEESHGKGKTPLRRKSQKSIRNRKSRTLRPRV